MKQLLSGNEAVARGAWEAGVVVASAYPGTPSTEILENLAGYSEVYAEWAPNEKVAVDVALGAAYSGRRALAAMKHVGLNVASDSLFSASMTGLEAGLVIVSADDPHMHSSQNEQDNRRYARFARIPCLEPAGSQEALDLAGHAFDMSERFDTPVLLRLTTRICHSSGIVTPGARRSIPPTSDRFPRNPRKYVLLSSYSRQKPPLIEERIRLLSEFAETSILNRVEWRGMDLGIVTGGVAYQYAREVLPEASILKLGMTYPLPAGLVRDFASQVRRLIVVEELGPFLEEELGLLGVACEGKSIFPAWGELDPHIIGKCVTAAGLAAAGWHSAVVAVDGPAAPPRPPVLCPGCPHRAILYLLNKRGLPVAGDIGCYTLGVLPPLSAMHTCGCMGGGIGVAHGAAKSGIIERMVAVIGDSTFFHSGIPALTNVAHNQSDVITIILDNRTTGMTGHQQHPGTEKTLQGDEAPLVELEPLVRVLGIRRVRTVPAYDLGALDRTLKEFLQGPGPAVLIARQECALLPGARNRSQPLAVVAEACNGCGLCFQVGCPALVKSDEPDEKTQRQKATIDPALCTGCEVCAQVCSRGAILYREQMGSMHVQKGNARPASPASPAIPAPLPPGDAGLASRCNFLVAGVGGQGTILAGDVLAGVGLLLSCDVKKSEVHGVAQRGGSVNTHVRWNARGVHSPLVGMSEADVLVALEVAEAIRHAAYLRPGGVAVINRHTIKPAGATLAGAHYPTEEELVRLYAAYTDRLCLVPASAIAQELGNARMANVVLLGALSVLLGVPEEPWLQAIAARVPDRHQELNDTAFRLGRGWVEGDRGRAAGRGAAR